MSIDLTEDIKGLFPIPVFDNFFSPRLRKNGENQVIGNSPINTRIKQFLNLNQKDLR